MKTLFFIFLSLDSYLLVNDFCFSGDLGFGCNNTLQSKTVRYNIPRVRWSELSLDHRAELVRSDYRVGLPEITAYQRTAEFKALPKVDQQREYEEQWMLLTGRSDTENLATYQIEMPTGVVFTRVLNDTVFGRLGVTYVDEGTHLRWSSPFKKKMSWYEADQACRELGPRSRLPTKEEYEKLVMDLGINNEFRLNALLPRNQEVRFYWSSSGYPDDELHFAYGLDADEGSIDFGERLFEDGFSFYPVGALCVE